MVPMYQTERSYALCSQINSFIPTGFSWRIKFINTCGNTTPVYSVDPLLGDIHFRYSGFSLVQSLSHVRLFVTPQTAAWQASLSITNSRSLLKVMSIELVMPSNHLILYCPLLFLSSIFLSIRIFSNESAHFGHMIHQILCCQRCY